MAALLVGAYPTMSVVATPCLKAILTFSILARMCPGTMFPGRTSQEIDSFVAKADSERSVLFQVSIAVTAGVDDIPGGWRLKDCSLVATGLLYGVKITFVLGAKAKEPARGLHRWYVSQPCCVRSRWRKP